MDICHHIAQATVYLPIFEFVIYIANMKHLVYYQGLGNHKLFFDKIIYHNNNWSRLFALHVLPDLLLFFPRRTVPLLAAPHLLHHRIRPLSSFLSCVRVASLVERVEIGLWLLVVPAV